MSTFSSCASSLTKAAPPPAAFVAAGASRPGLSAVRAGALWALVAAKCGASAPPASNATIVSGSQVVRRSIRHLHEGSAGREIRILQQRYEVINVIGGPERTNVARSECVTA